MRGSGDTIGPDDEAYGRVTNPERYRPLHRAAADLLDQLVDTYDVERHDGVDLDPEWVGPFPGSTASSLMPAGGGSPVLVTFTTFPGINLKYGYKGRDAFPSCGCDACDDQPDAEAERMTGVVADAVAGGFTEIRRSRFLRADTYESVLAARDGSGWSGTAGTIEPELANIVPTGTTAWPPWRHRHNA